MAEHDDVAAIVRDLLGRLDEVPRSRRGLLPGRRLVEASCPDLDVSYHALWTGRALQDVQEGPSTRVPDIRIQVDSDDLLALADGRLDVGAAFESGRIRVDAPVRDLLRLRAALS